MGNFLENDYLILNKNFDSESFCIKDVSETLFSNGVRIEDIILEVVIMFLLK